MVPSRLTLFRARGVPIRIGWSWFLIVALLVWSLGGELFPRSFVGLSTATAYGMAAAATVLFFVSVVLHELGHAFRAQAEGVGIEGISLWLFGGVAQMIDPFPSPAAELRIAAAGPAVTALITAALALLAVGATHLGGLVALRGVLDYLAVINVILLVFNLLPALPLDGGRMLHALIWRSRNEGVATRATSALGQGLGVALAIVGVGELASGARTTGIWVAVVGLFVLEAARSQGAYGTIDRLLAGLRLRDLLLPNQMAVASEAAGLGEGTPVLAADTPVIDALRTMQSRAAPIAVGDGDGIAGMVSLADVSRVLQTRLARNRVASRRIRGASALWLVVVLAAIVAGGILYHPPFYVLSPGTPVDITRDVTISGVPNEAPSGHILLVDVNAYQHNVFTDFTQLFHAHRSLITTSEVGSIAYQKELFAESEALATVAAGAADGKTVTLSGDGALVTGPIAGTPAASVLRAGDVIVAVDGSPVATEFDLMDAVSAKPSGTTFALSVQRGGSTVALRAASSRVSGQTVLGVDLLTKDVRVTGPFQISFKSQNIGGPSAGLAYALTISAELGNLDLHGGTISATWTLDQTGKVGDVGDVDLKAVGATAAGDHIFITPADETAQASGLITTVKGVTTLQQALDYLRSSSGGGATQ
ncbi:MAG: site-2 protease family protein [Actinomycetota bacterium]